MTAKSSVLFQLYERMRLFAEANRFVDSYMEISLAEQHALVEMDSQPGKSRNFHAHILGLSVLSTSRILSRLEKRGLAFSRPGTADRRERLVWISEKGSHVLSEIDAAADGFLHQRCADLIFAELCQFGRLLEKFCNDLNAPPSKLRPFEHPLRPSVRRFTRGLSLLEDSVFGMDGVSSVYWHTLEAIAESIVPLRAVDLCTRFHMPRNSASVVISRLKARRWLRTRHPQGNSRDLFLELTAAGAKQVEKIREIASQTLVRGTRSFGEGEATRLAEFATILLADLIPGSHMEVCPRIVIRRLVSMNDRSIAQKVFVETQGEKSSARHRDANLADFTFLVWKNAQAVGLLGRATDGAVQSAFLRNELSPPDVEACLEAFEKVR